LLIAKLYRNPCDASEFHNSRNRRSSESLHHRFTDSIIWSTAMGLRRHVFAIEEASDPAVEAWQSVIAASENDMEYEAAILDFERSEPTTAQVLLKRKLERQRRAALNRGDCLTWAGALQARAFAQTIDNALARLVRMLRPSVTPTRPLGGG
jgi:uncharacterized protein with PIN domain